MESERTQKCTVTKNKYSSNNGNEHKHLIMARKLLYNKCSTMVIIGVDIDILCI